MSDIHVKSSGYIHVLNALMGLDGVCLQQSGSKFISLSFLVMNVRGVSQKQYIYFNKLKKFMKLAIYHPL